MAPCDNARSSWHSSSRRLYGLFFGIGFPLLALAAISGAATDAIMGFLTRRKRAINLTAGIAMLGVSLYYLIFVFEVFDFVTG